MTLEHSGDGEGVLVGQRRDPLPPRIQKVQDELLDQYFHWLKREAYCTYGHPLIDMEAVTRQAVAEVFAAWEECRSDIPRHLYEAVIDLSSWYRENLPDPHEGCPVVCEDLAPLFAEQAAAVDAEYAPRHGSLVEALYVADRLPAKRKEVFQARAVFGLGWREASRTLLAREATLRGYEYKAKRDLTKAGVDVRELTEFLAYEMRRG
ncbi:hypothetical protein AB0B50_38505 [Streptomyces sp. NPDC041068]|uniref:hypothetical protein n=1 Tax=Streptomyces sp. NPDC041068 TaxID=3155130 RepID=UPI0033C2EB7B